MRDLVFTEEGQDTRINGKLNRDKVQMTVALLTEIRDFQMRPLKDSMRTVVISFARAHHACENIHKHACTRMHTHTRTLTHANQMVRCPRYYFHIPSLLPRSP